MIVNHEVEPKRCNMSLIPYIHGQLTLNDKFYLFKIMGFQKKGFTAINMID